MELKIGDKLKDNDPRMPNRVLTIAEVLPNGVMCFTHANRTTMILRRRIYTDGKPRRSGFSLVQQDQ